jgi:TolB-like protein/Tfp pilus assembly protein PilF
MKRCPECRRDYYDDSLLYCLDDGTALLEGPASLDEPATAIVGSPTEPQTRVLPISAQIVSKKPGLVSPRRSVMVGLIIILIAVAGLSYWYFKIRPTSTSAPISSVAVLPFQNTGGNPDSEYLSDGLAESLIYRLSQIPELKVAHRSSAFRYKGQDVDAEKVGGELGVDAVMSGRLIQRGDSLLISVDLVDVRNKKTLWGEQFDRKMSDLLATQREIAAIVAQKLQLKLSGNETGLTKQYTNDNEAYQLYLKGRFYWNKRTPEGTDKAIELFKAASEKDPNFALAYVGLADSYLVSTYSMRGQDKDVIPLGAAYALRALNIDPSLAEANASLGLANTYQWNWAEAEKYFKRSIEINPNYASARHWYSRLLRTLGRNDEAFEQITLAKKADELSVPISNNLAENLFDRGDYTGAMEEARRGIAISPHWTAYRTLAYCDLRLGQTDAALADAKKSVEVANGLPVALKVLGYVQAQIGNRAEALAIAKQIEASFAKGEIDGRDAAVVYAALGENDKAFEWLEKDFQSHNVQLIELRMEIPFIPLRTDSRFKDLLKRMNMPD